jgi:hypothetical protein
MLKTEALLHVNLRDARECEHYVKNNQTVSARIGSKIKQL